MTQDQYNRAIEIHNRLICLNVFKEALERYENTKLAYTYKNIDYKYVACEEIVDSLRDIFIRHDKMIREEIENKIKSLQDEIKTL